MCMSVHGGAHAGRASEPWCTTCDATSQHLLHWSPSNNPPPYVLPMTSPVSQQVGLDLNRVPPPGIRSLPRPNQLKMTSELFQRSPSFHLRLPEIRRPWASQNGCSPSRFGRITFVSA